MSNKILLLVAVFLVSGSLVNGQHDQEESHPTSINPKLKPMMAAHSDDKVGHEHADHGHDHAHEHGHDHGHDHAHEHGQDHGHDHAHEHGHDDHAHDNSTHNAEHSEAQAEPEVEPTSEPEPQTGTEHKEGMEEHNPSEHKEEMEKQIPSEHKEGMEKHSPSEHEEMHEMPHLKHPELPQGDDPHQSHKHHDEKEGKPEPEPEPEKDSKHDSKLEGSHAEPEPEPEQGMKHEGPHEEPEPEPEMDHKDTSNKDQKIHEDMNNQVEHGHLEHEHDSEVVKNQENGKGQKEELKGAEPKKEGNSASNFLAAFPALLASLFVSLRIIEV